MLSVSATMPSPGNAASPCTSTGATARHVEIARQAVAHVHALARPRDAREHGIHDLEVARVRNELHTDRATVRERPLGPGAEVVLHVAGLAFGGGGRVLAVELAEDLRVRLVEDVREHVDAPAMRHRDDDLAGTGLTASPR